MSDARTALSPLDQAAAAILPGLEIDVMPMPIGDEELATLKAYTADGLLRAHPDRYALATGLFFGAGLSVRDVCRYARVSPHTMQCIITREAHGELAGRWRAAATGNLRAMISMALSVGADMLVNRPQGLNGAQVASLLRECVHAHELLEGRATGRSEMVTQPSSAESEETYFEAMRRAHGKPIEAEILEAGRTGEASADQADAGAEGGSR